MRKRWAHGLDAGCGHSRLIDKPVAQLQLIARGHPPHADDVSVVASVSGPPSLRKVKDLLFERRGNICHATVRQRRNPLGPMVASEIRRQRAQRMRVYTPLKVGPRRGLRWSVTASRPPSSLSGLGSLGRSRDQLSLD